MLAPVISERYGEMVFNLAYNIIACQQSRATTYLEMSSANLNTVIS